jgi:glutamate dehydrogenase (NAD(P)+)
MGGIRITPQVTVEEVAALAHKMTLKLALAELPIGGAKAGVVCDLPPGAARDRVLRAFGRLAGPLLRGGVYLGSDMGCSYRDRDLMHESGGYTIGSALLHAGRPPLPCTWPALWQRCANATGHGVAHATLATAEARGLPASRRTVAIQGFGVVGRGVAQILYSHGYSILAVADLHGTVHCPTGLPIPELCALSNEQGLIDRGRLPRGCQMLSAADAWLHTAAGVLVLAAGADALDRHNADQVTADLIVDGANLPTTLQAQAVLAARGITVVPDILANIGGAMVTALVLCGLVPPGLDTDALVQWLLDQIAGRVRSNTATIWERSEKSARTLHEVCQELASERAAQRETSPHRAELAAAQ